MNHTYWICPWCHVANFRDHEGLDECDYCHSETNTRFDLFGSDRIWVTEAWETTPSSAVRPPSSAQSTLNS